MMPVAPTALTLANPRVMFGLGGARVGVRGPLPGAAGVASGQRCAMGPHALNHSRRGVAEAAAVGGLGQCVARLNSIKQSLGGGCLAAMVGQ